MTRNEPIGGPTVRGAQAFRSDPRFASLLDALEEESQFAVHDAESFDRVSALAASAVKLVTTLAIETRAGHQRMYAWSAPGVPMHHRASSEARAWSSFTLASIDRDSARMQAAHASELAPQYLVVSLPPEDAFAAWFVQFEGFAPFDSASVELLRHLAARLREVCVHQAGKRAAAGGRAQ